MTNLSNLVEILAKQALGSNLQAQSQQSGLGGILGSVLGQLGSNSNAPHQQQSQQAGLGGILGSVLGHLNNNTQNSNPQAQQPQSQSSTHSTTKTLFIAVLPLVLAWIQQQGGIQGALEKLKGMGLGKQVEDWVSTGTGENASVDQQQVQSLFDEQQVEQLAQKTQVPKQDIYSAIAKVLPTIIDSLTPQGEQTDKQEANHDIQQVMNLVSGFLKR